MAARSSPGSKSHLFTQMTQGQSRLWAMAATRSMRNGSVTGMAWEAMMTSWSMLATAGR